MRALDRPSRRATRCIVANLDSLTSITKSDSSFSCGGVVNRDCLKEGLCTPSVVNVALVVSACDLFLSHSLAGESGV
jgi:hypothetical protein